MGDYATWEEVIDAVVFEAMRQEVPGLVDAVSDLLARGQTPDQIRRHIAKASDHPQLAGYAYHVACHLQRIG